MEVRNKFPNSGRTGRNRSETTSTEKENIGTSSGHIHGGCNGSDRPSHFEIFDNDSAGYPSTETNTMCERSSIRKYDGHCDGDVRKFSVVVQKSQTKKYEEWKNSHFYHLQLLYWRINSYLKTVKIFKGKEIEFKNFAKFAYEHSSGYISPYI